MIYDRITSGCQLQSLFRQCGREEQFTAQGFDVLYDYLEEWSASTGEDIHADVIALCCDFAQVEEDEISEYDPESILATIPEVPGIEPETYLVEVY